TSELFRPCSSAALRENFNRVPIAADQRLFFGPGPTFELSFGGNGVDDAVEVLRPDQLHRAPFECVAGIRADLMLLDAPGEIVPSGAADVVGIIGAAQHVHVSTHSHLSTRSSYRSVQQTQTSP